MGRRKNRHEKEPNLERWLVSYADFITLLFAVFVTLYAMSQVDKEKAEAVIQSLQDAFGMSRSTGMAPVTQGSGVLPLLSYSPAEPGAAGENGEKYATAEDLLGLEAALEAWIEAAGVRGITAENTRRGLVISLEGTNFFDPGSAHIREEVRPLLERISSLLAPFANPVRVEGFTDNLPADSARFASNWELSSARAAGVVRYLAGHRLSPERLAATGYGEFYPGADNGTEEGRRRNRRVDIVLLADPAGGAP